MYWWWSHVCMLNGHVCLLYTWTLTLTHLINLFQSYFWETWFQFHFDWYVVYWSCCFVYRWQDLSVAKIVLWTPTCCTYWWVNAAWSSLFSLLQYGTQWRIKDFPDGATNPWIWTVLLFFKTFAKTAWKWKKKCREGARVPGTPFMDPQMVPLSTWKQDHLRSGQQGLVTDGLCGTQCKCSYGAVVTWTLNPKQPFSCD